jgi:hypothetical protein
MQRRTFKTKMFALAMLAGAAQSGCALELDEVASQGDADAGADVQWLEQAAIVAPSPRAMPTSVEAARHERSTRADRLVEFWYRDYLWAKKQAEETPGGGDPALEAFGDPLHDGGVRAFRRVAAVLRREGAQAAALVEQWTQSITHQQLVRFQRPDGTWTEIWQEHIAGTSCSGPGDYDMKMKEMVSLIYMFKDRPDVLTNEAVYNILTRGLRFYLGPNADKMVFSCPNGHMPETENHVLMIESSRYLTNQFIYENPRGDHRYYEQFPTVTNENVNPGSRVEDILLQAMGRIVWGDFFEFNARTYQGLAAHALLNLYDHAHSERVRAAAKNALDFATTKYAFGSFEGKRWSPMRRNHGYANTLNMHEQDSFVLLMAALSGGYVWDDVPRPENDPRRGLPFSQRQPLNFYEQTWSGAQGTNMYQGLGLAMWGALSNYSIPEASHDFLLNKRDGYWARMHPRHYHGEYEEHHWSRYFTSPTTRWTGNTMVFAPESYFVTPRFMNAAGGSMAGYPLRSMWSVENEADPYDQLSKPIALLTRGHYGAWPDNVSYGRCDGIWGTHGIHRNTGNVTSTLLTMMGDARFWKSRNDGVYKSFGYGYYYNDTCGASRSEHTMWPMDVPGSWSANQYREGSTHTWAKDRAHFRFYDLRNEHGFYVVLGRVSKSRNMDKYRKYSRGFWEVVPAERFASAAALKSWVLSDANNPARNFNDGTSGEGKWFKYKMTTGETVWLDIIVGFDDGAHNDPILKIIDANGAEVPLASRVYSRNANQNPPLLEVYGVDAQYRNTQRYAYSVGDGQVSVSNPFTLSDVVLDSSNYTAQTRIEQGSSMSDAIEVPYYPNQHWVASRTASGFVKRLERAGNGATWDVLASEPIRDNQTASFEIGHSSAGLVFDWGVSSEAHYDALILVVDGAEVRRISGEQVERSVTIPLAHGFHLVEFRYVKDRSVSQGRDSAWVDAVRFL